MRTSTPQPIAGFRLPRRGGPLVDSRPGVGGMRFFNPQSTILNRQSLVPQRHHGIDFRRPARRDVARYEAHGGQ
jgi:hypothetical protein